MRSAEDRHTVWLTLTEAGHEKLREVWPDHRDSIYLYFGQYLEVAAHNGTYVLQSSLMVPVVGGVVALLARRGWLGVSHPFLGGVGKVVEHRFRSLGET